MGSRVLFLTNSELGQASLCLAVAHELLHQPTYNVHIASFEPLRNAVSQLNIRAAAFLSPTCQSISTATFHVISGLSMRQALEQRCSFNPAHAFQLHGLGYDAAIQAYRDVLVRALAPWTGEEYMTVYRGCEEVVDGVDPALIVVDPLFTQAVDACRQLKKKYVVLSPNTFKEHVAQPWLANLWKYPMYVLRPVFTPMSCINKADWLGSAPDTLTLCLGAWFSRILCLLYVFWSLSRPTVR